MKQFITKMFMAFLGIMLVVPGFANEYGYDKRACDIRYNVTSGTVDVHYSNSAKSKVARTVNGGDKIYVDNDSLYYNGEDAWVKISGAEEYILSNLLTIEENPMYISTKDDNLLESKESMFRFGFYDLPKWLAITMLSVWVLLALFLCWGLVNFRFDLRWRKDERQKKMVRIKVKNFILKTDEDGYGMPKVLFFSPAPYGLFTRIALYIISAFFITIALFLLLGGLTWVVAWAGRILLVALYWIVYIGLYVLGAGLILYSFSGGRLWVLIFCWIPFVIAEPVGELEYEVYWLGETLVEWGNVVFTTFNIFDVSLYIINTYWFTALVISVTPLVLFLCAAVLFMMFAGALMLYEYIKMKRYNVSHPCPYCGEHSEPAIYLSDGIPLNVPLRPGVWGMYSIVHPATGEKMPTLFSKGKDRLERRCAHCDNLISANIGAEKHVAVAGVPNSGKSTLLYRIISELCRMKVGNEHICSFTDNMGANEASAKSFLDTIKDGQEMGYFPEKTAEGRHKSIQLLAQNPKGDLPYRLYINDIAGEMFTSMNNQYEDAPFFKNTNVLIFALDPFTMQASDLDFSPEFDAWYKKKVGDKNELEGKVDLNEAFTALANTISKYRKEKSLSKIKLMITYVKTDEGYLGNLNGSNDSALLREFAISEMGLENLIFKLETMGFDVSYHAISASDDVRKSGISDYISEILDNLDISFRNLSAKQLAERNTKMQQRSANSTRVELKNPNVFHRGRRKVIILGSFILAGLIIWGAAKITSNINNSNYAETMALVEEASSKPLNYDETMSVIKTAVAEKSMNSDQKDELTKIYKTAAREKRNRISRLRSILYANFKTEKGRMSNIEVALKYNVLDKNKFKNYFEEFKTLAPEDADYLKYSEMFNKLLSKYKVKL